MESPPARFSAGVSLGAAIRSVLLAKKLANLRPRYLQSLRQYLAQFARGREDLPIASVDVFTIEDWFASRKEAITTTASNMGRLASLFSFAKRRGWVSVNPCEFLERPRIDDHPPQILTPDQSCKLLAWARTDRPHRLPYFVLALLAGVRPEELERIHWQSVDLDRGLLIIDGAAAKTRHRRIVELHPKAVALLRFGGSLPVTRSSRRRYLRSARKLLGLTAWPQDILRHSAASFLLAKHKNAGLVAFGLGNSAGILMNKYSQLVSPEQMRAFFESPHDNEARERETGEPEI